MDLIIRTCTFLAGLTLLCIGQAHAATDLDSQIANWKPGEEVPHALLSFPDGNVPSINLIHSDTYEAVFSVRPHILNIKSDELLEAIVFDPRSERGAFEAAVVTLVDHKGLAWFAKRITNRSSTDWRLDALREILNRPFSRCAVAFVAKGAMSDSGAKAALEKIKSKLDAGASWKIAYGSVADEYPDEKRRRIEPGVPTTLIGYMFSGWVSGDGYDFSSLHFSSGVPTAYFAKAIRLGRGGKIVSSPKGDWLIYSFEVHSFNR